MDGDGDPRRALHPQETEESPEWRNEMVEARERAVIEREKASKKARKKRRRDRRRATLELEQRPRVIPSEAPRPDYTLAWRPLLAEDHPEPPAFQNQAPPYHPHYVQQLHRRRREILAHQRREDLERAKKARQEALASRRPSSSRQTGSSAPAGTATRVRQSVLYSDRPRRSRRPSSNKLPVDEHAGEVSSREFEALTLGQSPPTFDSTHRVVMHASDVGSGALDSTIAEPSALEQELLVEEHAGEVSSNEGPTVTDLSEFKALVLNDTPPELELIDRSDECSDDSGMTYGTLSDETYSEIIEEEKSKDESDYDLEEERREIEEYLQANMCGSMREALDKMIAAERATLAADCAAACDQNSAVDPATQAARIAEWVREQPPRLIYHNSLIVNEEIDSLIREKVAVSLGHASRAYAQHSMAPSRDELSQQWSEDFDDEDIIENGKKWMSEEVMVAFRKYVERSPNITGLEYNFEELCHQCFNVECYYKIFHHYNFTMKMKNPSSVDWRVVMYFAEVKEIFGRKYYFCCPLESSENGQCYACNNQGMNDLKHPATGGFDRGSPNTVFPYSSD